MRRLKCKWCGEVYRWMRPRQGINCASTVSHHPDGRLLVEGHYGSRLWDLTVLRVVNPVSHFGTIVPMDPVCDLCVEEWRRMGNVVVVGEVFSDGTVTRGGGG